MSAPLAVGRGAAASGIVPSAFLRSEGDVHQHPDTERRIGICWEGCPARHRPGPRIGAKTTLTVLPTFHTFPNILPKTSSNVSRIRQKAHPAKAGIQGDRLPAPLDPRFRLRLRGK